MTVEFTCDAETRIRSRALWAVMAVCLVLASAVPAKEAGAQAVVSYAFDADTCGWQSFDPEGRVSVTTDKANVKTGAGALEFAYTVKAGATNAAAIAQPRAEGAKSLSLWAKTSAKTALVLFIGESDGSRYLLMASAPADEWIHITSASSDLVLDDTSEDENGKLDLADLSFVAVGDMASFFAQDTGFAAVAGIKLGPRRMWLDQFEFSQAEVAPRRPVLDTPEGRVRVIDGFDTTFAGAFPIGAADAKLAPLDKGGALSLSYTIKAGELAALGIPAGIGSLAGLRALRLVVHSTEPVELMLELEEKGGGKYQAQVPIKGSPEWQVVELFPEHFVETNESKDADHKLDPAQVAYMLLMDVRGFMGQTVSAALFIDEISALVAK